MRDEFTKAVPEIPVRDIDVAVAYYTSAFGFNFDWGDEAGGIAGISRGECRMFLTNRAFREEHGNQSPVMIWLNLENKREVDELHDEWRACGAKLLSTPESKPWLLHEFTATDPDGNRFRVFYDFRGDG